MKRIIRIVCVLLFVMYFVVMAYPTGGHAGTFMIGAKSWFAVWDSAIDQELANLASEEIEASLLLDTGDPHKIETDVKQGYGFIAGPLLGYQSDDGLWSFSGAIMILNSFTQETDGTVTNLNTSTEYNGKYELELNRSEIDLAVTRALGSNFKVFAGYKHLTLENKFSGKIEGIPGYDSDIYKVDITIQIPTIGVGYVYPFTDKVIFGLQLGILYAMPDVEYKDYLYGESGDVDVENTLGYTGEVNLSFLASEQFLLQAGYRYQAIKFTTDSSEDADIDAWDQFHGVSRSLFTPHFSLMPRNISSII